jgi:hypothetical protein
MTLGSLVKAISGIKSDRKNRNAMENYEKKFKMLEN